jgi:hypothetical protein
VHLSPEGDARCRSSGVRSADEDISIRFLQKEPGLVFGMLFRPNDPEDCRSASEEEDPEHHGQYVLVDA